MDASETPEPRETPYDTDPDTSFDDLATLSEAEAHDHVRSSGQRSSTTTGCTTSKTTPISLIEPTMRSFRDSPPLKTSSTSTTTIPQLLGSEGMSWMSWILSSTLRRCCRSNPPTLGRRCESSMTESSANSTPIRLRTLARYVSRKRGDERRWQRRSFHVRPALEVGPSRH